MYSKVTLLLLCIFYFDILQIRSFFETHKSKSFINVLGIPVQSRQLRWSVSINQSTSVNKHQLGIDKTLVHNWFWIGNTIRLMNLERHWSLKHVCQRIHIITLYLNNSDIRDGHSAWRYIDRYINYLSFTIYC